MNDFAFQRTPRFDQQVKKLPQDIYAKLNKCLALLSSNPRHPSLRNHKVEGSTGIHGGSVFEAYVDIQYRLTWEYAQKATILLRNVGNHDACLANP